MCGPSDARRTWVLIGALTALSITSRLPQLLSPHLLLDGDESIVGLMAKHVAVGREFPIFFYGQNYGLAVVETIAGASSFVLAGMGAVQLKVAMLALWTIGVVCHFVALSRLLGERRAFRVALILILVPAWGVSSMKAWSGYITAFAASAALFNSLVQSWDSPRWPAWMASGALTAVIYLAQPVWLPGVLPVVLFLLVARGQSSSPMLYAAGLVVTVVLVAVVSRGSIYDYWTRPPIGNQDLLGSVPDVLRQIHVNLTGSYNLGVAVDPGPFTTIAAVMWSAILTLLLIGQVYRLASRRYLLWSHLLFAGVASTLLANWVLLGARDARYLLPLSALLVMWAGIEMSDLSDRFRMPASFRTGLTTVAIALGALSLYEFRGFSFTGPEGGTTMTEAQRLAAVIDHLKIKGATRVFSMHPLLQWQLMFYGQEAIVARWTYPVDRYPPFVAEVDRAFHAGEPIALVGYVDSIDRVKRLVPAPTAVRPVGETYFVYVGPRRDVLHTLGVRFAD